MSQPSKTYTNLVDRDRAHLWHPLTQHKTQTGMLGITSAKGVYLYDEQGKAYIDAISSWYTCVYGHCNPRITERVAAQMQQLDQVVFAGLTHEPAVRLSESLIELLPENQNRIFFSDNGSTSVEVAVKMALQYHFNRGERRNVLLAFEEGFHGDTFGAMSVSGLSVYNGPFQDFSLKVRRIPVPNSEDPKQTLELLRRILSEEGVAAFIYEPLIQGAAAMKTHHPKGLERILATLKEAGVLLIADEVMTGFGKTGSPFASAQLATYPDIMCLSKALTAGLLPMGATSCTETIYEAFLSDELAKGFFHGHTYTANPLSCTAALAAIECFKSSEIQDGIQNIATWHKEFEARTASHPMVADIRSIGVILALDLNLSTERYGDLRDRLYRYFLGEGIFLRPLGNTIYLLPPYTISQAEIQKVYAAIERLLDRLKMGSLQTLVAQG